MAGHFAGFVRPVRRRVSVEPNERNRGSQGVASRSNQDTALLRSQVFPEGRARTLKIDKVGVEYRLNVEWAGETNEMIRLNDARGAGSNASNADLMH